MNLIFTKEKPTAPGFFVYREEGCCDIEGRIELRYLELWWCSEHGAEPLEQTMPGEWCRLVPAYELKAAFNEAKCQDFGWGMTWENSRAKRIAEGEEQ